MTVEKDGARLHKHKYCFGTQLENDVFINRWFL
jgi:hypothetical protein